MKLEKVNSNQVRCLISRKELRSRSITTPDDLSYGSPKVKRLFNDVMSRVGQVMDIEAGKDLLSIEAVPAEDQSLCLIITKTDSHDELDGRFAEFTDDSSKDIDDNNTYNEPSQGYLAIQNDSLSALVEVSKRINCDMLASSTYLVYKGKHVLFLVLRNEFHDDQTSTPFSPYLVEHFNYKMMDISSYFMMREHGTILIDEDAVDTLSNL